VPPSGDGKMTARAYVPDVCVLGLIGGVFGLL
jgi:hypothetical protein